MVLAALTLQPDAFKVGVDLFGISDQTIATGPTLDADESGAAAPQMSISLTTR